MNMIELMKMFLKATLPIVDGMDLDVVIAASAILSKYYARLTEKDDVSDDEFKRACALIVSGFDGDSIHYLEETIKDFKEEVL